MFTDALKYIMFGYWCFENVGKWTWPSVILNPPNLLCKRFLFLNCRCNKLCLENISLFKGSLRLFIFKGNVWKRTRGKKTDWLYSYFMLDAIFVVFFLLFYYESRMLWFNVELLTLLLKLCFCFCNFIMILYSFYIVVFFVSCFC